MRIIKREFISIEIFILLRSEIMISLQSLESIQSMLLVFARMRCGAD